MKQNEPPLPRIIQLESICVSLEKAQELNNTVNAAHAWVWNPYKNYPEYELKAVEHMIVKSDSENHMIQVSVKKGKWDLWNADVFVAWEQIQELIKLNHFFFAPLTSKHI